MRTRQLAPVVAALILGTGVIASPLAAGRPARRSPAVERRAAELRELVGEASAQEAALLDEVVAAQARRQERSAIVAGLDSQLSAAHENLGRAFARLAQLDAEHAALVARMEEANRRAGDARQRVNVLVDALYRRGERADDALGALLTLRAKTPHDLFAASRYLSESARERRQELSRLSGLLSLTTSLRRQVETSQSEARVTRDAVGFETSRLEQLRSEQARARAEAAAEEGRERRLLEEAQLRKADFARELALLEAESSSIAQLLRLRQLGQVLAPRQRGLLRMPVAGPIGNRRFGPQRHPILGSVRMHNGVDMRGPYGDPIVAAASGEIVLAGPRGGYGYTVIVDHGNGLATLYAHQSRLTVAAGERVAAGALLGFIGSTGLSTGPHLHFEVRELGTPVDPLLYL